MHQCLAEITTLQHADEGGRRILKAVGNVLAIADAAIGDGRGDRAQKRRIVLGREFVVDVAAQGEALAQHVGKRKRRRLRAEPAIFDENTARRHCPGQRLKRRPADCIEHHPDPV